MSVGWFLVPTGVFTVLGAAVVARLWPTRPSRLVVFGVLVFGSLVVACQVVGVVAALLKAPLVRPPWIALASALLALACWRAAALLKRGDLSWGSEDAGESGHDRVPTLIIGAVALAVLSHAVVLGLSAPPRGWDVLAYHMPKALAWLQHGNLGNYGSVAAFYPGNGETAILLSLFTGTDRLASIVQLPFALLGAAALYGLARELGARARAAAVPAVVFLVAPIVLFQSAMAKDDLMVTGLVLAGVLMLLRSTRPQAGERARTLDLVLSGLALGLALGVKYSILAFVVLSVPVVFFVHRWVGAEAGGGGAAEAGRILLRRVALFAAALAVPSAFWFLQNWIVAGSPLAPLSTEIVTRAFGRHDGMYVTSSAAWLWFPWIDRAIAGSYSISSGFGAAAVSLAPPAIGLSVWMVLRGPPGSHTRLRMGIVLGLLALAVATWWFGGHHLPRFLLPALGLACVPTALLFDRVVRDVRVALVGLLVLAACFSTVEALRVVYRADDLVSSRKAFIGKAECYHMPGLVYELPPGTKIMLLSVPGVDVFRTFKYPVAGDLPGNEVVMMGDFGVEVDLVRDGPVLGHAGLVREGVDYLFLRTLALPPGSTLFDRHPDLYEKVLDTVEEPYDWYRKGFLPTPGDGFDVRAPAVTKVYRVLSR